MIIFVHEKIICVYDDKKLSYDKTYMASFIFPLSVTQSTLFILHTAAGDKDGRNDESHGGGDSIYHAILRTTLLMR